MALSNGGGQIACSPGHQGGYAGPDGRLRAGYGLFADGMMELDWEVGELLKKVDELGIDALRGEVSRAIEFGHQERLAVLEALTTQREEALFELHRNIIAEREALTRDMEALSLKVVDHALHRTALLAGLISVGLCAWTVVLLFLTRRLLAEKRRQVMDGGQQQVSPQRNP